MRIQFDELQSQRCFAILHKTFQLLATCYHFRANDELEAFRVELPRLRHKRLDLIHRTGGWHVDLDLVTCKHLHKHRYAINGGSCLTAYFRHRLCCTDSLTVKALLTEVIIASIATE